jgi:hypothetical protein
MVGHESKRFGDGFKVVGTGASLAVTVKAGFGAFLLGTQLAVLLQLAEDATVSGFTAWTGTRTDYVYIDISESEISAAEDPDIVNPDVGEETCRDLRLDYSFHISAGAPPGAAPSGHVYIILATITKTTGSNIASTDVTVLLENHYQYSGSNIWNLFQDNEYSRFSNSDAAELTEFFSESSGAEHGNIVLRAGWWHQAGYNTLNLEGYLWVDSGGTAKVRVELVHLDSPNETWYYEKAITATFSITGKEAIKLDVSGRTPAHPYHVTVTLLVTGSSKKLHLFMPALWMSQITDGLAMTVSLP